MAGLLLYAILRIAYSTFYQSFGLTPDDLGLGYLDLLAQAAVGTVGLTVVVGLLFSVYIVVFRVGWEHRRDIWSIFAKDSTNDTCGSNDEGPQQEGTAARSADDPAQGHSEQPQQRRTSTLRSAAPLAAAGVYVGSFLAGGPLRTVAICGTFCGVAVFLTAASVNWFKDLDESARERLDRQLWGAMFAAFVLVAASLVGEAVGDANAVQEGRSARPTAGGLRLASWGADRATLLWVSQPARGTFPGIEGQCLMYLGQSDGTVYLYKPQSRETLRLSANDVVVMTREVTRPCPRQ